MNSYDQVVMAIRLTNAVLASLIFMLLVVRGWLYLKTMNPAQKAGYTAFTLYALGVAQYSYKTWSHHMPADFTSFLFLFANITVFVAVWWHGSLFGPDDDDHDDTITGSSDG